MNGFTNRLNKRIKNKQRQQKREVLSVNDFSMLKNFRVECVRQTINILIIHFLDI